MVDVEFSPYELKTRQGNIRKGTLLKFTFNTGGVGYSDCHLWPEFGDPTLDEMIGYIRFKRYDNPYFQNMLIHAYIDLRSRQGKMSLGDDRRNIKNHYLIQDITTLSKDLLQRLELEGFTHIKLKVGRDISKEIELITKHFSSSSPFQLRLDFNSLTTKEQYVSMITELVKCGVLIEFCEDPFSYDHQEWIVVQEQTGVSIAADRYADKISEDTPFPFIVIIKPAVDELGKMEPHLKDKKFVVTSYLDHPVGQVAAAYRAQLLELNFPENNMCHGLLSHHVYQPNQYSKHLSQKGPYFVFPKGCGVGFEEELKEEPWVR